MSDPKMFWMVRGPDGPPRVMHMHPDAAEAEAERLARVNPGKTFYVLEAIAAHRRVDVERIDLRDLSDEVPF